MTQLMSPTLGGVISISKGKKHEISGSPSRTAKRLIGIDDLRNDNFIRYTEDSSGVEATPGDVLIAWDGANAGTTGFGKSGYIGSTIARLRLKDGTRLFTPFLGLYLKSKFDFLRQTATGTTIPHINRSALESIPIPQIDFNDQIRIAHLLGKVEGLIAQRKHHLQQLDALLKSVFLEMFGDPVRNEKGWETAPIERFCEAVIDCPHSTPEYSDVETGYYCVRSSDVAEGYLDLKNAYQVSKEIFEDRITRYRPRANDIVYSREGGRLGNAARISGGQSICLGQRMMLFKVNSWNRPEFLWALLESAPFKLKLRGLVGGGAAPRVNIKDLKKLVVVQPGADLQMLFSKFVLRADHLRARYEQSLTNLEALYGALSQQAFRGELDLSRVALPAAPIEGESSLPAALPAPSTTPVIELPETDLLMPALQDRTQLALLLRFWLEAYRTQLGRAAFSLERFIAAAESRIAELHPDNDFEWAASDYECIKTWVFEALAAGALTQAFDDDGNRVELKALSEPSTA